MWAHPASLHRSRIWDPERWRNLPWVPQPRIEPMPLGVQSPRAYHVVLCRRTVSLGLFSTDFLLNSVALTLSRVWCFLNVISVDFAFLTRLHIFWIQDHSKLSLDCPLSSEHLLWVSTLSPAWLKRVLLDWRISDTHPGSFYIEKSSTVAEIKTGTDGF